MGGMTTDEFADALAEALTERPDIGETRVRGIDTYETAGFRYNSGLVVRCADQSEYQITVVRSR